MAASNSRGKRVTRADSDAYESGSSDHEVCKNKKQKISRTAVNRKHGSSEALAHLFEPGGATRLPPDLCTLPRREHPLSYHRPQLLDQPKARAALLKWFDSTATTRGMPWRKPWIDPMSIPDPTELRNQLERRAYEVWISEIMLQQTRVAVVIDYWNRWITTWPTIQELAKASPDDVLAMWRGLGYYSRATRIHEAAKLVCADPKMHGLLPDNVVELEKKVPGVGRYTAGAVTAIVFGKPSPMVDGNVLRVLSRQLGVFGDVKTDKATIDMLWAAAEALVKAVANDTIEDTETSRIEMEGKPAVSDKPGRWGQALMELGSTVCTPKPNCESCPITTTCRVYAEGWQHAMKRDPTNKAVPSLDIEDSCTFCKPFEDYADDEEEESVAETKAKGRTKSKTVATIKGSKKQASLQSFFFTRQTSLDKSTPKAEISSPEQPDAVTFEKISNHARKFPVKAVKKAVREEETLVCAILRKSDGQYLIQKRPEKGLLAGLWEFPSRPLSEITATTAKARKTEATRFVKEIIEKDVTKAVKHVGELESIPWLFSHIKLIMHVHLFVLDDEGAKKLSHNPIGKRMRWTDDVEGESMGTGMRKCWGLVKDSISVL